MNNQLHDFINKTIENQNDYIWITFSKSCGYSFIFPFLRNDNINALYRHLDILNINNSILIWLEYNNQKVVINRSDNRTIRDVIVDNNTVYFETINYNHIIHGHHDCKHIG